MRKQEFLCALKKRLSGLPKQDVEEHLNFYSEMIDDRVEEGLLENDAVLAVGSIDEIVSQISKEFSINDTDIERAKKKNIRTCERVLLIIGSPLWFSLLIVAFAVIISFYAVMWSLVICLWAIELPFFIFSFISKYLFMGCKKITEGSLGITKKCAVLIKNMFGSKGK